MRLLVMALFVGVMAASVGYLLSFGLYYLTNSLILQLVLGIPLSFVNGVLVGAGVYKIFGGSNP
jgi:hypothetical protein